MGLVNFSGLASGLDTKSIVDALVNIQRIPIQRIQAKKSNIDVRISKLGELSSKLEALKKAGEGIGSQADILAYSGASSDDKVATVTTGAGALPGSFEVTVHQLARAEKNRSAAFGSANSQVTAGTLSIATNGGAAHDIEITEGMRLRDVADAINGAGIGVQASIVSDGTSSYLQVSSKTTGYTTASADDAVTIVENYTGGGGQQLGLTQFQQAQNALVEVDQLMVTSTTNTVANAVEGVTFELIGEGDTVVNVASDRAQSKENIQAFLDAYNDLTGFMRKELRVEEGQNRDRRLASDPAVRQLRQTLSGFVSGFVPGTEGQFSSLSQIGIKTNSAGALAMNDSELEAALDADPFGVAEIFLKADTGIIARAEQVVKQYTNSTDGILGARTKSLQSQTRRYDDQIVRLEDRLDQYRTRLTRQFTAMETTIAGLNAQSGQIQSLQLSLMAGMGG